MINIEEILVEIYTDDITVSGADMREISKIMQNTYHLLKAKDKQIKQQEEMIKYLRGRAEDAELKASAKLPPKVDIRPLISKFETLA